MSTVVKALDVLFCVARAEGDTGVTELCRLTGLDKATVHRSLKALQGHALIEQCPDTRRYRLGLGTIQLAGSKLRGMSVATVAQPYLTRLSQATGETVQLSVRQGHHVLYVAVVESAQPIRVASDVGSLGPLHATAAGKVFLAFSTDGTRELASHLPLPRLTPSTLCDLDTLAAQLAEIRQRGWSVDHEELVPHLRVVAAPIVDRQGQVTAAVAVGGPTQRVPTDRVAALATAVTATAREISAALAFAREQVAPAR